MEVYKRCKMKNKGIAILFILIGISGLISNYFGFPERILQNAWVMVFWIIGFAFEIGYFKEPSHKNIGLLVPGGLFLTLGFIFSFCSLFGYSWMEVLWPLFILAPAVGLFQLYFFGERNHALLIPVGILGTLSGIFLLMNLGNLFIFDLTFPAILIVIGVLLMFVPRKKDS